MTFDLDIWLSGSTWHCLCQVWRSRSQVRVQGQRRKCFSLALGIWHATMWRIHLHVHVHSESPVGSTTRVHNT